MVRPGAALALLLALVAACGGSGGGSTDAGPDCPTARVCGASCCTDGEVCEAGGCATAPTCDDDDDCQGDRYCDELGVCVAYPDGATDDECTNLAIRGVFAPAIQCEWAGPAASDGFPAHANVLSTPVVADFRLDGDDPIVRPSIAFVSYNGTDGSTGSCVGDATLFGVIRVVDGQDCALQHTIAAPAVIAAGPLAVADLDGAADGRPELVGHRVGGGLVAFRFDPATAAFVPYWASTSTLGQDVCLWSGPSIHDLDDDGAPEVIMGASVFSGQTGAVRDDSLGLLLTARGHLPVVADLDGDGAPELVTGAATYEWDKTASAGAGAWGPGTTGLGSDGLTAVADFGSFGADPGLDDRAILDGAPEIVVVRVGTARIMTPAGRTVFGPISLRPIASPGNGGPPTIADFDGDGRAELAVAGLGGITVFDPDCAAGGTAATCPSGSTDGVLWDRPSQDQSSSQTSSAVFDFEGDERAELVYGDECFSRVYDGAGGEVLYSAYRSSCTWYENPVVADVDGDFNSEIVIPSNVNCSDITCPTLDPAFDGLRCLDDADCPGATTCALEAPGDDHGRCRCALDEDCGGQGYVCVDPIAGPSAAGKVCRAGHPGVRLSGIRVVRDALDRWVNSRPVWNQHAYAVTHIDDDASCPATASWQRNWTVPGLNNFRQAIAGAPEADLSPDLTGRDGSFACTDAGATLTAELCNRGTEAVAPGLPATFYAGAPEDGVVLCTATTTGVLAPGACELVSCVAPNPPSAAPVDVTVVADDDGAGGATTSECHEENNRAVIGALRCDGPVE